MKSKPSPVRFGSSPSLISRRTATSSCQAAMVRLTRARECIRAHVFVFDIESFGLPLTLRGPKSLSVVSTLQPIPATPPKPMSAAKVEDPALGETYLTYPPGGVDLFVPVAAMQDVASRLLANGARWCG
jgi:hypothetical protein